jgi:YhcH/YjgK/YiaL family protein
MLYGSEIIMKQSIDKVEKYVSAPYDEENDITLYDYDYGDLNILNSGDSIILYPNDAHKGAIALNESLPVRKIVIKIPVE